MFCVDTIGSLMSANPDFFIRTYAIRNPSHPFIDMLRNDKDENAAASWQALIYQKIEHLYSSSHAK